MALVNEDPLELLNWKRERVLGSGGFGTVTLWREKDTNRMIALKKCRGGGDTTLTPKQKERWKNEVEIMQRLNHPNVVRALPLPDELAKLHSELPMLCMEYCSKGDLRQLLNRPENCCGLPENDVRRLIENVNSAVCYLHSQKITHRDLKPENIVLSTAESGIIYKLIDLGYAKELDTSSLCTSFVGTLQYLAPELFSSEKYSSSVDYWSLGLVSHEVITGVRPFLPNMAPVAWMKHVQKKSPEHICGYQTSDGRIEFSSHLFPQNHISSVLKREMERWLKLVLEWDPKKRGRDSVTNEIIVFSEIQKILEKQIVNVFCMVTYNRLSYEVDNSTSFPTLQRWIESDTQISVEDQELLLANGQPLDLGHTVVQCLNGKSQDTVFVCQRGSLALPKVSPNFPDQVAQILQYPRERMEYIHQRRAYSHAVFFLQQDSKLYKDFLLGCRLKLLSLVLFGQKIVRESQKVTDLLTTVTAQKDFCFESYKFDAAHAKDAKMNNLSLTWRDQVESMVANWTALNEKAHGLTQQTQNSIRLARKLQTSPQSNMKEDPQLIIHLQEGLDIMDKLRRRPNSERSTLRDSVDMVRIIYNFLKQRDVLLYDKTYNGYLKQIEECEDGLTKIQPELEDLIKSLNALKLEIQSVHHERQRSLWDLLTSRRASVGNFQFSGNLLSSSLNNFHLHSRSESLNDFYSENNPPPVPPHGIPALSDSSSFLYPSSVSSSRTGIQSLSRAASQPCHPVFDVSLNQLPLNSTVYYSNGSDSGISNGVSKCTKSGSVISLTKPVPDDFASLLDLNKSLRLQTQELMMENFSRMQKVLSDDQQMNWDFLKADTR